MPARETIERDSPSATRRAIRTSNATAKVFSEGDMDRAYKMGRDAGGPGPAGPGRHPVARHVVIVAVEYIGCVVMIVLSAGVGKEQTKSQFADPAIAMVRLVAVSALFFVLAIFTSGPRSGRLAAAFGGLVTAAVFLNAVGEWETLAHLFGQGPASWGGTASGSGASPSSPSSAPTETPAPGGGQAGDVGGQCQPGYRYDAASGDCVINTAPVGGHFGAID